mgnify:CR=1 FL=1
MKNKFSKQGFTLIELLGALIVVIIVIAIAIPLISNIKEIVRREAFRATAHSIADAGRLLIANENESQGYQEFYYQDGKEYNADGWKLDYSGTGPRTGVVVINEKNKVVLAIHNGTYCATKSADTNTVTVTKTKPEECNAYSIIETCDTWEQLAIQYDVIIEELLAYNNETDPNSSTCDRNIKIPISSNNAGGSYAGSGSGVYYKTYYTVGYVSTSSTLPLSYEYTIQLGVLPLPIEDIKVTRVTMQSVFEELDDFKRYIVKKNMGEVIWPGGDTAPINISQASVFKNHAARNSNMTADDVMVMCDTEACYATVNATVDNLTNVNPNTIEGAGQVAYTPIKFTVEFNGEGETCAVRVATDTTPGVLAGVGTNTDPHLVESIEDLVALSNNVSTGNTYSGKYISLAISFDFKNKKSYMDFNTTEYGDINGNGIIEGLFTELTTGAGFKPIGSNTATFRGVLLGNIECIFNLYINRPTTDYIGFIGYNNGGKINALTLNKTKITGGSYTGGLAGHNNGVITESSVLGDVIGVDNVGLAAGYSSNTVSSVITNGNVSGVNNVGGVIGNSASTTVRSINKGGSVSASGIEAGRIIGKNSSSNISALALSSTTVNGSTITDTYTTSIHGADFKSLTALNNINLTETALDTYIGGDNDGDGYYWDYNTLGKIVQKSTARYPLTFTLAGTGTEEDPYLITNANDLKMATSRLYAVYKLTGDIDLLNARFYMLGSRFSPFTGKLDGNGHTIKNLNLNVSQGSYIGFSGYNGGGTIKNIIVDNIKVTAQHYTGALIGYNTGTVDSVILTGADVIGSNYTGVLSGYNNNGRIIDNRITGNVIGGNYVGLVTGYFRFTGTHEISSIIAKGNVTGADYVGGTVGFAYYAGTATEEVGSLRAIYTGGRITSTGTKIGRIVGGYGREYAARPYVSISSLALSSTTLNGATVASTYPTSIHGADIANESVINNMNLAETSLDTYIGGDTDGNGYYWDYGPGGTLIHRSIKEYPLTFALSGGGSVENPYIINNYTDLKQASLRLNSHYKITSDIYLGSNNFYMLGSFINRFSGSIDGTSKTIYDITIDAPGASYIGFIGYNQGSIRDLNLVNINVTASNFAGGLMGYSSNGEVLNTNITGNVEGLEYVGLITGYFFDNAHRQISSVTVEGDVTGTNYVGGMAGRVFNGSTSLSSTNALRGVYKGGSLVSTVGTAIGRITGSSGREYAARPYTAISALALSSVTVNGSPVDSTMPTSLNGASISSLSELNNINLAEAAFDTYIGGDNDGDGYYWDYDANGKVVRKTVSEYPLTFGLGGGDGSPESPYNITGYDDLRKASLQPWSSYKLTADINLGSLNFYMLGSHVNPFTGSFNGNAKTISNLALNIPSASYVGFIGYNRGPIKGLHIDNMNINAANYAGCLAGYTSNVDITDHKITGNINAISYAGLAVGYFSTSGTHQLSSVLAEGDVFGVSHIGGLVGRTFNGNVSLDIWGSLKGVFAGDTLIATVSNIGRITGSSGREYAARPYIEINASAVKSTTLNGSEVVCLLEKEEVPCTNAASINGADIFSSDLSNTTTYTDRGFNFSDETQDYIWYIDGTTASFRAGNL